MFDLNYFGIFRQNDRFDVDAVFRPGIDAPFSPTSFNNLEMGETGSSENTNLLNQEEDKENSPPTTPVSERPVEPLRVPRSRPFGGRVKNVPEFVYRTLFDFYYSVHLCNVIYNENKIFH